MPPARLGLVYSHTGLRKFIDVIGVARTRELFYTARNVDARRAASGGSSTSSSKRTSSSIAPSSTRRGSRPTPRSRCAGNKQVIGALLAAEGALDERVCASSSSCARRASGPTISLEGVRAFGEKRRPVWRGE